MITMMDRVVDSQDKQLRHQKFEMGEQEKKFQQDVKELKEVGIVQLREQEMKHRLEMKELKELGVETTERLKVEHDAKVDKLEQENKVLKSEVERLKLE